MTTPTNSERSDNRQTSERERLAERLGLLILHQSLSGPMDALCSEAAAQLRADEAEIVSLRATVEARDHEVAALSLAQMDLREGFDALRAENEALRTVVENKFPLTDEDVKRAERAYLHDVTYNVEGAMPDMRAALQSFIRSKEARRGGDI